MILKAAAEGLVVNAAIASEPDASEFLQMDPAAFSGANPLYPTIASVAPYPKKDVAMERIRRINIPILFVNRDRDELQGIFDTAFTWMKEADRKVARVSWDHPVHGYIARVLKDANGAQQPDAIQLKVVQQALDFFKKYMAP